MFKGTWNEHACEMALTRFLSAAYAESTDDAHGGDGQEGKDSTLLACDLDHNFKKKKIN